MNNYMAYIVGKPSSITGKKVQLAPSVSMNLEDALLWLSEKHMELRGKEISIEQLDELQSRGELDIGDYYLCLDKEIDARF